MWINYNSSESINQLLNLGSKFRPILNPAKSILRIKPPVKKTLNSSYAVSYTLSGYKNKNRNNSNINNFSGTITTNKNHKKKPALISKTNDICTNSINSKCINSDFKPIKAVTTITNTYPLNRKNKICPSTPQEEKMHKVKNHNQLTKTHHYLSNLLQITEFSTNLNIIENVDSTSCEKYFNLQSNVQVPIRGINLYSHQTSSKLSTSSTMGQTNALQANLCNSLKTNITSNAYSKTNVNNNNSNKNNSNNNYIQLNINTKFASNNTNTNKNKTYTSLQNTNHTKSNSDNIIQASNKTHSNISNKSNSSTSSNVVHANLANTDQTHLKYTTNSSSLTRAEKKRLLQVLTHGGQQAQNKYQTNVIAGVPVTASNTQLLPPTPNITPEAAVLMVTELGLPKSLETLIFEQPTFLQPMPGFKTFSKYQSRVQQMVEHVLRASIIEKLPLRQAKYLILRSTRIVHNLMLTFQQLYFPRNKYVVLSHLVQTQDNCKSEIILSSLCLWTPNCGDDYFTVTFASGNFKIFVTVFVMYTD